MEHQIRYSVILPTFNRVKDLEATLKSLVAQNATGFEIIIVDDCSDQDTRIFAEAFIKNNSQVPCHYLRLDVNGGHGKARNAGVAIARGELILFTDDDCILPPNWVETHVDAHGRYPEAAGVGGWYWSPDNAKNIFDRFYELEFLYTYPNMKDVEVWTNTMNSPAGNTANMSYKTKIFQQLKGFDETIYFTGGIDWELKARCIATGHSLVSIPLSVTHTKHFTPKTFVTKTIKLGRGLDYISRKYPSLIKASIVGSLGHYATWKVHPIIKGEMAWMALSWALLTVIGKATNRLVGFKPSETFDMRSAMYFTYRQVDGKRITSHEVMPFDPTSALATEPVSNSKETSDSRVPKYSVVIPTYNRKVMLLDAIGAVLGQENIPHSDYEIVIVDDGSTDGTQQAIEALQQEHPDRTIRYQFQNNQGAALARNAGAALALGDIIFFTDSDCRVRRKWMWATLQAYRQHPDLVGTGGGILMRHKDARMIDRFRNGFADNRFVARYKTSIVKTNDTTLGVTPYDTASMSVRAEVFRRVGGFFPVGVRGHTYYHEDVDFAARIQMTEGPMALVPDTYVLNMRLVTYRRFWKESYMRGVTLPALIERLSPHCVSVCVRPTRVLVCFSFLQCLVQPFSKYNWISFLNLQSYAAGYREGMRIYTKYHMQDR